MPRRTTYGESDEDVQMDEDFESSEEQQDEIAPRKSTRIRVKSLSPPVSRSRPQRGASSSSITPSDVQMKQEEEEETRQQIQKEQKPGSQKLLIKFSKSKHEEDDPEEDEEDEEDEGDDEIQEDADEGEIEGGVGEGEAQTSLRRVPSRTSIPNDSEAISSSSAKRPRGRPPGAPNKTKEEKEREKQEKRTPGRPPGRPKQQIAVVEDEDDDNDDAEDDGTAVGGDDDLKLKFKPNLHLCGVEGCPNKGTKRRYTSLKIQFPIKSMFKDRPLELIKICHGCYHAGKAQANREYNEANAATAAAASAALAASMQPRGPIQIEFVQIPCKAAPGAEALQIEPLNQEHPYLHGVPRYTFFHPPEQKEIQQELKRKSSSISSASSSSASSATSELSKKRYPDLLVPVRVELDTASGRRIRDIFCININESPATIQGLSINLCKTFGIIPKEYAPQINTIIIRQLTPFQENYYYYAEDSASLLPEDESIFVVKLNIRIKEKVLEDQFEWDARYFHAEIDSFATRLCKENSLPMDFAPLIAHSMREQVLEHVRLAREGRASARRIPKAVIRNESDAIAWQPLFTVLSHDEVQQMENREEREARVRRRRVEHEEKAERRKNR